MRVPNTRWWAIEDVAGVPLADGSVLADTGAELPEGDGPILQDRCRNVLVFTEREYAQQILDASGLAGLRLVLYSGRSDAARFLAKVGALGADAFVLDAGQAAARWFSIHREDWLPFAVTRARAAAIGLEVPR